MAKRNESTQEFKFLPGMTFGTIAAERDSLLSDCFFRRPSTNALEISMTLAQV